MSDLRTAIERLMRAVDGLEDAAARRRMDEADRASLAAELAQSRADCARLQALTGGMAGRLDGAIATIKHALEA